MLYAIYVIYIDIHVLYTIYIYYIIIWYTCIFYIHKYLEYMVVIYLQYVYNMLYMLYADHTQKLWTISRSMESVSFAYSFHRKPTLSLQISSIWFLFHLQVINMINGKGIWYVEVVVTVVCMQRWPWHTTWPWFASWFASLCLSQDEMYNAPQPQSSEIFEAWEKMGVILREW